MLASIPMVANAIKNKNTDFSRLLQKAKFQDPVYIQPARSHPASFFFSSVPDSMCHDAHQCGTHAMPQMYVTPFLVPLHTVILLTQRLFPGLIFPVLRVHHKHLPREPSRVSASYACALLCHQLLVAFYLEPHSFSSHTFFGHRHLSYRIKVISVSIGCGGS